MKYVKNSSVYCAVAALALSVNAHAAWTVKNVFHSQAQEAPQKGSSEVLKVNPEELKAQIKALLGGVHEVLAKASSDVIYYGMNEQDQARYEKAYDVSGKSHEIFHSIYFMNPVVPEFAEAVSAACKRGNDPDSTVFVGMTLEHSVTKETMNAVAFCDKAFASQLQNNFNGNLKAFSHVFVNFAFALLEETASIDECAQYLIHKQMLALAGVEAEKAPYFIEGDKKCSKKAEPASKASPLPSSKDAE